MYDFVAYGVDHDTEVLDYDAIRDLAVRERPRLIIAGATAYPRVIDFAAFRAIADEIDALLLVDAAHIAGLVAGGAHPSPVPYADVVTLTTHKTLRGPRAGTILCRQQYAAAVDKAVFPGLQGGPLMHVIAAKAVAFLEASRPEFRQYAADIVTNAAALADGLAGEGFRIVSGGTENHLMLVDLRPFGVTGKVAQEALDAAGITCNKNAIPNDPEKPFVTSGLRLGTASVTTAGMGVGEMREIASLIAQVLRAVDDSSIAAEVREQANRLCSKFTPYPET
jgi:glycine hydroxymethyltransferase